MAQRSRASPLGRSAPRATDQPAKPGETAASELVLPRRFPSPGRLLGQRLAIAIALIAVTTLVVFAGRSGYHDSNGTKVSFVDSLYFATVSLSTTGYGDVVPVTTPARLVNIIVITPLRLLFLLVLVGTTLEVLTASARQRVRAGRWRDSVHDHVVIIGYGTKGRAAAFALIDSGVPRRDIAVVDVDPREVATATADGATAICADGTRVGVLEQVEVSRAARVVIGTNRDDTTVLATLTVRQLNATATIVAVVRHAENAPLLRLLAWTPSSSPPRQPDGSWAYRHSHRRPASSSAISSRPAPVSSWSNAQPPIPTLAGRSPQAPTSCSEWCATVGCAASATPTRASCSPAIGSLRSATSAPSRPAHRTVSSKAPRRG